MSFRFAVVVACTAAIGAWACSQDGKPIHFHSKNLFPEGIAYDSSRGVFLVSSFTNGTIGSVSVDGQYSPLITDDKLLTTSGLHVDARRQRLLACNSDRGFNPRSTVSTKDRMAVLSIFDLRTLRAVQYVRLHSLLPGRHFCNDVTTDERGDAYVTDSYASAVYHVTPEGRARVFLRDSQFDGPGSGLNGIIIVRDLLLISKHNDGKLFAVPLLEPQKFWQVRTEALPGADGLMNLGERGIALIANRSLAPRPVTTNAIVRLTTRDGWKSAEVAARVETGAVFPTTGALYKGQLRVLFARLDRLQHPESPVSTFSIGAIDLP